TVPHCPFREEAALGRTRAGNHGEWRRRDPGSVPHLADVDQPASRAIVDPALDRLGPEGGWLEPEEVMGLLQTVGLRVPITKTATTEDEAVAIAAEIGRSVLKVISPSALHKSDVGGVVLDVSGEEGVRAAYRQV